MVTMAGLGPPLFKTQMTKLCPRGRSRSAGIVQPRSLRLCYSRACDAERKEVSGAQPIDGTLGDLEILRGGR